MPAKNRNTNTTAGHAALGDYYDGFEKTKLGKALDGYYDGYHDAQDYEDDTEHDTEDDSEEYHSAGAESEPEPKSDSNGEG